MYRKLKMKILRSRLPKTEQAIQYCRSQVEKRLAAELAAVYAGQEARRSLKDAERSGSGFASDVSSAFTRLLSWLHEPAGK